MARGSVTNNVLVHADLVHDQVETVGQPADLGEQALLMLTEDGEPILLGAGSSPDQGALRQTRGRIVLVGSVAGVVYSPGNIYGATKWAVTGLAENTRRLVTGDGVGVTLINPGAVETNFFDAGGGLRDRAMLTADQLASSIVWAIRQPAGVDINTITVRPLGSPL